MSPVPITDVVISRRADTDALIREINVRLRRLARACDDNLRWDDLRFPATGINPAGSSAPPDEDTAIGGLLFDDTLTEVISFIVQLPHGWREGTALYPHVHWQKTINGTGGVYWRLSYRHCPINGAMDVAWTQIGSATASTPSDTADIHQLTPLGSIAMTGRKISHILVCQLERVPADGGDTYGDDARLLEIDFHYQTDFAGGSLKEYLKD